MFSSGKSRFSHGRKLFSGIQNGLMDRAWKDLFEVIVGIVGTGIGANRSRKYTNPDQRYPV
jgi:hypothetical protein